MKLLVVCCLLLVVSGSFLAQENRDKKLEQLKSRTDIKVSEIEKDILKLEYPSGKVLYKNISDYKHLESNIQKQVYSPIFDSTIIDLRTIDTTLYYQKYKFWQEVPIHNWDFDYLRIGDVNTNGKTELYGSRKFFDSDSEPITVYELNESEIYQAVFQYDSVYIARSIFDVDKDGKEEVQLTLPPIFGNDLPNQQRFFSKHADTSLASELNFIFAPFTPQGNQLNDIFLGDLDQDENTDLLFVRTNQPRALIYIYEYNSGVNNFDSIYRFEVNDPIDIGVGGFSVGDFDSDGKKDVVFSTVYGKVFVVENGGDNQYTDVWQGSVESNNAYIHTWTNDIDKNGKPEFWVLADAYYNGIGTTRVTIFETNGDNSYQAVGRIDLVGVFSFYAGNMEVIDIDGDGTEEVAICIDGYFMLLKFNGTVNHHTYEVYYIKKNELDTSVEYQTYFGATMFDVENDGEMEILISMAHTIPVQPPIYNRSRGVTKIYKPDSTTSVDDETIVPFILELHQNYPNPFNPVTNIRFGTNQTSKVSLRVYNVLGKEIITMLESEISPGNYTIDWEARDSNGLLLPSGVYFIKLSANNTAGNYTQVIKALLLK